MFNVDYFKLGGNDMKVFFTLMLTGIALCCSLAFGADDGGPTALGREHCDWRLENAPDSFVEVRKVNKGLFPFGGPIVQFNRGLLDEHLWDKVIQDPQFEIGAQSGHIHSRSRVRQATIRERILHDYDFVLNDAVAMIGDPQQVYEVQCKGIFEETGMLFYNCTPWMRLDIEFLDRDGEYFIPYRDLQAISCERRLRSVNMLRRRY